MSETTPAGGSRGPSGAHAASVPSTDRPGTRVDAPEEEPTIGELVADVSRDVSRLIQHEIALAKNEVKVSVRNGGIGVALFGAAAFLLLLAVVMLTVAFAHFLHMTGLDLAWCYLIVFAVYTAIAALLALVGWKKVRKVGPPKRAIKQAKETKEALLHRGGPEANRG